MVLRLMVAWENDDAAMHAMLALTGRCFSARLAWDVGVKLKHGLLFDHDPSDPRIGYGEHQKQAHDGTGTQGEKLDAEREGEEDTSGEDVDGPFESHQISLIPTSISLVRILAHMPKEDGSMSMSPSFIIFRICLFSFRLPPMPFIILRDRFH